MEHLLSAVELHTELTVQTFCAIIVMFVFFSVFLAGCQSRGLVMSVF